MHVTSQRPVDGLRVLQTPEGVDVVLPVAGPVPRALAWLLDLALRGVVVLVITVPLAIMGDVGTGVLLLGLFLVEWLYPVVFEVLRGATPGKQVFGLRVVHDDGTPIGWNASILRNLLRGADFLPFGYMVGLISTLVDVEGRRLGDIAAGTVVIHKQLELPGARVAAGRIAPPPHPLTLEEQRAVIEFAERTSEWTPERARELAALAQPLVAGQPDGPDQLAAIARWLLGRR